MAKILVVDDDPASRTLLADTLRYEGHQIFESGTPHEGLEILELHHPDLVISDNRMPGMSGVDFLSVLRASPVFSRTPFVLCSASEDRETREAAGRHLACKLLNKPFSLGHLREAVSSSLSEAPAQRDAPVSQDLVSRLPEYLAKREADLDLIGRALEINDLGAIERAGHNMKGTGSSFGFPGITAIGGRLETAALSGDHAGIARELTLFASCLREIREKRARAGQEGARIR